MMITIFVLLDKTIVDVAQDGIHFFDEKLNNEDKPPSKNLNDEKDYNNKV